VNRGRQALSQRGNLRSGDLPQRRGNQARLAGRRGGICQVEDRHARAGGSGAILGFDEFWYVPHTPSARFVLPLDDMEGKSMTLTFAGDWPNTKLADKKSQGLK
jgi:hypothetical protein